MTTDRVIAKLIVYDAPNLPVHRRNQISNWLRRQGRLIENQNEDMAFKYTARFMSTEK